MKPVNSFKNKCYCSIAYFGVYVITLVENIFSHCGITKYLIPSEDPGSVTPLTKKISNTMYGNIAVT
jgi:hypothetical protein